VLLFERMVVWSGRADDIVDGPAAAFRESPCRERIGCAGGRPPFESPIHYGSNFCQEVVVSASV
jgi:hypothetical protein